MLAGTSTERTMVASMSDSDGESEAHLLEHHEIAHRESAEDGHHDQGGAGDDARCGAHAEGNGVSVVVRLVVTLADPAEQEDVVVHRQTEQHGEQEQRDPGLNSLDLL